MNDRTPERTNNLPLPIDASVFGPSLSSEIVTPGEMQALLSAADYLLTINGLETTINGLPARATKSYAEVVVDDKTYYARIFRLQDETGKKKKQKSVQLPGIVFDETATLPVLTPNPYAVRFTTMYNGEPALIIDSSDLDRALNAPDHVNAAKGVLRDLSEKVSLEIEAARSRVQHEKDQAAADKQANKERAQQRRRDRMRRIGEFIFDYAPDVGAILGVAGVLAGGIYGIGKINIEPKPSFDERKYELVGGAVIGMGQEASPEFSPQLFSDKNLESSDIPDVMVESQGSDTTQSSGDKLGFSDTLREVTLTSSKQDKNCSTIVTERVPLDSKVVAWSDFVGPNGESRANELRVRYEVGEVKVCWVGQERDAFDDPRVVVKLRPAADPQPR